MRHWKKRKKTKDMIKSYEREAETEEEEKTKNSPFGQITLEPFACRRNMRSPTPCSSELFVTAVSVLELGVSVRRSCMCRLPCTRGILPAIVWAQHTQRERHARSDAQRGARSACDNFGPGMWTPHPTPPAKRA